MTATVLADSQGSAAATSKTNHKQRRVTAQENFAALTSLLGGPLSTDRYIGWAGEWTTWEVKADATAIIDESLNIRVWKIIDEAKQEISQANLYQAPAKMAGTNTRFGAYLKGNAMSGRPDGYGVRNWSFGPASDLVNPDCSSWLDGSYGPPERALRVLCVPDHAADVLNGALPSSFQEGHQPQMWVLEYNFKAPGSNVRRWSSMNWYEHGVLVVNRCINEDLIHWDNPDDLVDVDKVKAGFGPRRDSFDQDMQLVKADGTCDAIESWQHHGATAGGQRLTSGNVDQSSIVEVCYPDWHYCKNPRDLRAAVEAGGEIIFEGGAVHGWVADSARNHNLQHRHWHLI
eukprot:jgi/Chrzof1/6865/Cz02g01120.t1